MLGALSRARVHVASPAPSSKWFYFVDLRRPENLVTQRRRPEIAGMKTRRLTDLWEGKLEAGHLPFGTIELAIDCLSSFHHPNPLPLLRRIGCVLADFNLGRLAVFIHFPTCSATALACHQHHTDQNGLWN
jgi:hypothetical protein